MNFARHIGFLVVLAVVIAGAAWLLTSQRQQATQLRVERDTLRFELSEQARLRAENERLRALQIPAADLEHMRADHAALPRLRAELEALQRR
jgi:Tfp pilus assembly protein PilO